MATIAQIRTAAKTTITAAISGLFGYDQFASVTHLPAVVVVPRATNFDLAMGRGTDEHDLDLIVLVSKRDLALAQSELDKYLTGAGSNSIRQAVFNARTLGLSGTDAHVTGMSGYAQPMEVAGQECLSATLALKVYTSGVA